MLNDADACHDVELLRRKRQGEDVGLGDPVQEAGREVLGVRVDGVTQIDRSHAGALVEQHLREPAGAASTFEHIAAGQRFPKAVADAPVQPIP